MLENHFSLQLKFAARYAAVANFSFSEAIAQCTNLRRRFNLVEPAVASRWNDFLAQVGDSVTDQSGTLSRCMALYGARPPLTTDRSFGCFSFDPPDTGGVLRIHFSPTENTHKSPLALENISDRVQEMRALFLYVRRTERNVSSVRGVSWLYNVDAYKRLFPRSYAASIRPVRFPLHLNGSSTWGQVLTWRKAVKPDMRDALLSRMTTMNVKAPWETFPLQALTATGDVAEFYAQFT